MQRIALTFITWLACLAAIAMPLPPVHVVWSTHIDSIAPTEGKIVWEAKIEPGWHIYSMEKPAHFDMPLTLTAFDIQPAAGLELVGNVIASIAPETHVDQILNSEIQWWDKDVTFVQEFRLTGETNGVNITGTISYMACNATSCTPPTTEEFNLKFGSAPAINPQPADNPAPIEIQDATPQFSASEWWEPVDENLNQDVAVSSSNSSIWGIFIIGFLGGLLALLTPCVWPMIPMTVSFFLKTNKNRRKSILNAVTYSLSIVVIFLVLGLAITAIFGASKLNEISTSAVFNIIFFLLLVFFAISFFGAFEIKLPSKWSNAIDNKAESTTGMLSIFFMAFTLVLVSFSCTGPIIGTLLVEAASEGEMAGPAMGMGGFALGLALPFGLFAIFPSFLQSMPKSGGWLNSVKVVLGFIELILSLKFLSVADLAYGWRILDREVFVAIWIVLFVLLGMYLLGKLRFPHDSDQPRTSVLGFFLATISFSFAVYMLPGLWGAPLKAISAFAPPLSTQDFNLYGGEIHQFDNYDEGMRFAQEHHMPVMVDFTGYGCVNCRKMEVAVFDTPNVKRIMDEDYVLIRLYVDDKTPLAQPLVVEENGKQMKLKTVGDKWSYLQRYKFDIASQPYYVLLNNQGEPLVPPRDYNENVGEFEKWLNKGLENYVLQ